MSYQVSYGVVEGTAPAGTTQIVVRAGHAVVAERQLGRRRFHLVVNLPPRDVTVRVTTVGARGIRATTEVAHVFGLPSGARPRVVAGFDDPGLTRSLTKLARDFAGTSAIYVRSLTTGRGGAWNAKARFPAASTLKLAIAICALERSNGPPISGSALDGLLRAMLIESDNAAANSLETYFGGSTSGGSSIVMSALKSIGIVDTNMYGGYETKSLQGEIPISANSQPSFGIGKVTTAADLARLSAAIWLASGGRGPLRATRSGLTVAEARYLLYLLAHVRDRGKLDRTVVALPSVVVLHKAGWIESARHDNGLVFWRDGVFVAAVMTWASSGTGVSSDILAGRVARTTLDRLRG